MPTPTPKIEVQSLGSQRIGASFEETAALRLVVRSVVACVLGVSKDHPDVEDCTHETLSRALAGHDRLREGEPLRPWVMGIARHVALDALRARKRDLRAHAGGADGAGSDASGTEGRASLLDRIEDPSPDPEERAASAERARRLEAALLGLPREQREALLLFHVEGLGYQEVARRMRVPLGTVATWIARGRRSIAEALGE